MFLSDKTAHRPSTQSNHQYFHFSKFREHQQSETALWRRLFLLVLVFNIYPTKVLVRITLHLGLCSLEMMLRKMKQFSSKTAHTEKQRLQRRCYNLHKKRPLVKMMMVIGTDGYIISAIGSYSKYCVYYKYINKILKCLQLFPALYDMICSKYLLHLYFLQNDFKKMMFS